jgi:regulator of protease activity HflC (stomatin/prohibitin superfamily)
MVFNVIIDDVVYTTVTNILVSPIGLGVLFIIGALWLYNCLYFVPQDHEVVLEHMWMYYQTVGHGIRLVLNPLTSYKHVNWQLQNPGFSTVGPSGFTALTPPSYTHSITGCYISKRGRIYDPPNILVMTRDRISVSVDLVIYYKIVNLKNAIYNTDNPLAILSQLVHTCTREQVAHMSVDDINTHTQTICDSIQSEAKQQLAHVGLEIERVACQGILMPPSIQTSAMESTNRRKGVEMDLEIIELNKRKELADVSRQNEVNAARFASQQKYMADKVTMFAELKSEPEKKLYAHLLFLQEYNKIVNGGGEDFVDDDPSPQTSPGPSPYANASTAGNQALPGGLRRSGRPRHTSNKHLMIVPDTVGALLAKNSLVETDKNDF